ncbi:uncharacterized protein LOC117117052 [Anneissia japonica]|uniref:uncharacterized protein LOC117117052 n=1 Tax=Anneissia japonica TaxID=1529436 RepID=UPI0014258005|nr:uncharacterized protein LOC117117052 [Anneissia japonica]
MYTKNWSTDVAWTNCQGIKVDTLAYILKDSPVDVPALCCPDFTSVDLGKLQISPWSVAKFMRTEKIAWWDNFISKRITLKDFPSGSHAAGCRCNDSNRFTKVSNEWLQIGKVCRITDDDVEFLWYSGTYSSVCISCTKNGKE